MLTGMVRVPQFGNDKEIFSLDEALVKGSLETLSDLFLVTVISSSVEQPVASLDGLYES